MKVNVDKLKQLECMQRIQNIAITGMHVARSNRYTVEEKVKFMETGFDRVLKALANSGVKL